MNRKSRIIILFTIIAFSLGWGPPWLFPEEKETSSFHLPEFFLKTMADSDIVYEISLEKTVDGIDLAERRKRGNCPIYKQVCDCEGR